MATMRDLIDRLASWKVNQVQLYSEHTFAYRNHQIVHAARESVHARTRSVELDAFCRERSRRARAEPELPRPHEPLAASTTGTTRSRSRPTDSPIRGAWATNAMTLDPANPARSRWSASCSASCSRCSRAGASTSGSTRRGSCHASGIDEFFAWIDTLRALPELAGREMLDLGRHDRRRLGRLRQLPDGVTVCEWGYDDWHPFDERVVDARRRGRAVLGRARDVQLADR